jgi:phospholipase C
MAVWWRFCLLFVALACARRRVDHVVVVMLENRSFDHVIGFLKSEDANINGLTGKESNPYNAADPNSPRVNVTENAIDVDPDAGHSVEDTTEQVFGTLKEPLPLPAVAPMDGFVQNAEMKSHGWGPQVMACFNKSTVPVISTLAREFAVVDAYYSSVPGPTEVNRMYVHSSTSHGAAFNDDEQLALGYPQKTIFEKLHENGRTWGSYFGEVPSTLFFDWMRHPANLEHFHDFIDFEIAAANNSLPDYSFIDPRYFDIGPEKAQDQHPSHSMAEGELFLKRVYEAVRNSPAWDRTLLVITYDEHGGFYDHQPMSLSIPNPDGLVSTKPAFNFTRSGVRVPMVLVSPLIEKGTVVHAATGPTPTSQYEHSSVPATISNLFELLGGPLTKREAWAGTLEHVLTRDLPRTDCPRFLPGPHKPRNEATITGLDPMSPLQEGFVKLAYTLALSKDPLAAAPPAQMNEEQGGCYVMAAIWRFLGRPVPAICA